MKFAFLASTLLSSIAMAAPAASPQSARAPQAPQVQSETSQSLVRFNMNASKPAPSFSMMPVFAIGGSGAATAKNSSSSSPNLRTDVNAGTNMEAGFLTEFGRHALVFQTGVMYKQHQLKISMTESSQSSGDTYSGDSDVSVKYVSVPVMLKARMRLSEGIRLAGRVGAELAVFAGGKMTVNEKQTNAFGQTVRQQSASADISTSGDSNIRPLNVYLTAGVGPEFRIARNQNIRVEGFYERMMLPIAMHTDADLEIHSYNAMLSYAFAF
jgi:hypothetical protein